MAIGFNLPGIPGQIRGTAEEAGAIPDLGQAMMRGFRSNLENIQGAPRLLAQQLVSNQLANTINKAKAKYAEPMAKTSYDRALADLQNQNLVNQYYGRMRESELASAGLSQAHQRMVNQYYPDLIKSQLAGAGLTQEHQRMVNQYYPDLIKSQLSGAALTQDQQRMVNDQLRRDMALKQAKQDIIMKALAQGATPEQANKIADEQLQNLPSISEITQSPEMQNYMTALQQGAPQQAPQVSAEGYSPIPEQENIFAPEYGQGYETGKFYDQQMLEALRQNAIAQELSPYMQVQETMPSMIQPQGFTPKPQQLPELQPYTESLAQAAPSYLEQPQAPVQEAPASYADQLKQQGYNTDRMVPQLAALDNLYMTNPAVRDEIEKQYPGTGIKREKDFPRDRFITTTTLPSGATKTEIQSLGGGPGGEGAFKAASPFGKANEDLRHYIQSGDLESAKSMKQYINNLLSKEGKEQTGFDKAYNEWEKAVKEFGENSPKAKIYGERLQSLTRGNQTIQLNKGFPITNPQTGEQGYAYPQDKDEKLITGGRAAFNYIYPILEEGVKPFSGTILETSTAIANAVKNQYVDENAAKQLENLLLADKIRQSAGIKELRVVGGGMFKKTLDSITDTLASDQIQDDVKKFIKNNAINRDIQTRVNRRFNEVINGMSNAELKARNEYIPIYPSQVNLKNNITQGLKKPASQKINQVKSKAAEPKVITVTPEMVKDI